MPHRRFTIAGQDLDRDPAPCEARQWRRRIGAQALADREHMPRFAMTEGDDGCFGIPAQDFVGDLVRAAKRRPAQPDLEPVDEGAHALACDLFDAGQRHLGARQARATAAATG